MAKKQTAVVTGSVVTMLYPTIGKKVVLDVGKLDEKMKFEMMIHGAKQRLGDAASGQDPARKFEMASRIADALMKGSWEVDSTAVSDETVALAISRVKSVPIEKARNLGTEKLQEYAKLPTIKAEIAKIAAERAAELAAETDEPEIEFDDDEEDGKAKTE